MLRIGINALHIKWGINAGTETYLSNIILPWYFNKSIECQYTLFCNEIPPWWEGEKSYFRVAIYPKARSIAARILLEQIFLPFTAYRKLDVLFNPGYISSLLLNKKQIVTIHDGFAWVFPREIGKLRSLYWKIVIPMSAKRADRTIAVSESTANDISRFCNIKRSKISVIYEGGSHLTHLTDDLDVLFQNALSHRSYFLCVGFFKDIKNPWRILEAYKLYSQEKPTYGPKKKLVLAGSIIGKKGGAILKACRSIPGVIVVGRVDDSKLASLYKNSVALIFPSLYEGFGIPIVEAQSLGCPVITSNVSSMPEVGGDGAIYVDHRDAKAIAATMDYLAEGDPSSLIEKGKNNSERFSWRKASNETKKLIEEIYSRDFKNE